jgi:hypothetical protein
VWYQGLLTNGMEFGQIPPIAARKDLTLNQSMDPLNVPSLSMLYNQIMFVNHPTNLTYNHF